MAKKSKKSKASGKVIATNGPASGPVDRAAPSRLTSDFLWAFGLILAVILAYQPVWHAGFIWDDDTIVTVNPVVVGPLGLKEIWTTTQARFYPLVLSTFWLEHALWGLAPFPYHLVNVLQHAASAVLLWRVLLSLEVRGAWLGAAIWALHPIATESVAWVSEMKNTESCVFYLLTILFFVKGLKKVAPGKPGGINWNYVLSVLFAIFSMLSKSSTLLIPIVLALCIWWVNRRWSWRDMAKLVPLVLIFTTGGLIVRQIAHLNGGNELHWAESWPERIASAGYIFWFYLGKLLWPHPLMNFYAFWKIHTDQWLSFVPVAGVVLALIVLWPGRRSWSRPCLFAFAYYLLNLLPVMGLFSMTGFRYSVVEDHLQYLACMGPLALAGAGLATLSAFAFEEKSWLRPALCAGFLLALGTLSWRQARTYFDSHAMWTHNLTENPACYVAYNCLAFDLSKEGKVDEAIPLFRRSLEIDPYYATTHCNLGVALVEKGLIDEAISEYQTALSLDPEMTLAHLKLGEALLQKGKSDEALAHYQRALEINPYSALGYNNIGFLLVQKGDTENGMAQYQKALEIDPNFALAHNNLGVVLFQQGRAAEAIAHYKEALAVDPSIPEAHRNLGLALTQTGVLLLQQSRLDEAIAQFNEAIKNDPTLVQAHCDLGIALAQKGQANEALGQFQEALRLKPDDSAAQMNLARVKAMIQQNAVTR